MIIAIILLYSTIRLEKYQYVSDSLEAFVYAVSVWMLCLFGMTEILSFFHMLNRVSLILGWGIFDLLLLLVLVYKMRKDHCNIRNLCRICLPPICYEKNIFVWIYLINAFGMIGLALWTTPYNWDSMTYHLSRIAHWAQNQTVAHYATNIIRQITSPMLGEFVNLHVYLLSGESDRFLNLLQCFSYLSCTVLIYGIAKKLGCLKKFCFLAALLYLAMPIAYAESLTTQVDNFAAFWLLSFAWLLLDFTLDKEKIQWNKATIHKVCIMGLCVAWGYLVKPSVCVGMIVFVLWLLVVCIVRKDDFRVLFRLILCTFPCIALPIVPELLRNLSTFHAVSNPIAGARQLVGTINPLLLFTNMCKNFVFNFPTVYLYSCTEYFQRIPEKVASILGVDLNHASITEDGGIYALNEIPNFGHDTAINPLIVWLFIICILAAMIHIKKINWKTMYKSYSLVVSAAFFLFCTIVRWEPFVTRYFIAYLALLCPMISLQLQRRTTGTDGKESALRQALFGIIVFICVLNIGDMYIYHYKQNTNYGAGARPYGYFVNQGSEYYAFADLCEFIKENGYQQIGIIMGENHFEYPFWAMLKDSDIRLEHVNVQNESSVYTDNGFSPQCIILLGSQPDNFTLNEIEYSVIRKYDDSHYLLIPVN